MVFIEDFNARCTDGNKKISLPILHFFQSGRAQVVQINLIYSHTGN